MKPHIIKAPNRGPFTLDGSRAYRVGRRSVALIDPGPDLDDHLDALLAALAEAREVRVLLTHGHRDHSGVASRLAREVAGELLVPLGWAQKLEGPGIRVSEIRGGDRIPTDQGDLKALSGPGHTRDHMIFEWPSAAAVFVGDLLLGRGDTTWVGEYPGCVADYLESLDRVEALAARVLYPGHGDPITDPATTVRRFRDHRQRRVQQVREVRLQHPQAPPELLAELIYGGEIPEKLAEAAVASIRAALFHLQEGDPPAQ